ncbi:MAG: isomerizing glutamine--fructose-6-phosphate transaminase, partial [Myxococcales bacterium]|nr:isomerizing glutamine--fructose-6-phosphate transaminase [Myxococcales bacterium]
LVLDVSELDLGGYAHHTRKEIEEQPEVVTRTMSGRLDRRFQTAHLGGLNLDPRALKSFRRIKVLGCGSACFAGSLGARMIESLARIPCEAEPAAEFRYRNPIIEDDTLYFAVSQSGETADTLMAVQEITRKGGTVLGVVNVVGSSIARACQGGVYLHAGPEVAVVSTKTFTATLVVFALLALHLARMRDASPADGERLIAALDELPDTISAVLEQAEAIAESARYLAGYENACFVGRGFGYPLAMEGALKLKEVSYIHAEACAASELKHGPLALITSQVPIVALVPDDDLLGKNLATLEQVRARDGRLLVVGHEVPLPVAVESHIVVPRLHPLLDPVLMAIPLQLLAYHAALARGCDVDRPRNLAKSVTVE